MVLHLGSREGNRGRVYDQRTLYHTLGEVKPVRVSKVASWLRWQWAMAGLE